TAQVRHLGSTRWSPPYGGCGLFFARRPSREGQEDMHLCMCLAFSAYQGKLPKESINVDARLVCNTPGKRPYNAVVAWMETKPFPPNNLSGSDWHRLEVTVTPASIRATWDDRPIGEFSAEKFAEYAGLTLPLMRKLWKAEWPALLPEHLPTLPTRGG